MKMGKYLCEYAPDHPRSTKEGYVYSHVLVAERMLGRNLKSTECVHHIDENKNNNSPENIMVFKTKADHSAFHHGCDIKKEGDVYISLPHKDSICPLCGKRKDFKANVCKECRIKNTYTAERPDRTILKNMIYNIPFLRIGEMFGVSDNAVRKWCNAYNLPNKKSIISSYSEEEWELI